MIDLPLAGREDVPRCSLINIDSAAGAGGADLARHAQSEPSGAMQRIVSASSDNGRSRDNNFGIIRLGLACFVVVSHSPELIDGNRSREPLSRFIPTMSLGSLAVTGFFLVSGYLIAQSFDRRPLVLDYAIKRIARIVPGYMVSFLLCAFLLAPLVGATVAPWSPDGLKMLGIQVVGLRPPTVPGVFPSLAFNALNGSMWTIAYEARCYVLIVLLGLLGLFRGPARLVLIAITVVLLAASAFGMASGSRSSVTWLIGFPDHIVPLAAAFLAGTLFYVWRERIALTALGAMIGAVTLACLVTLPSWSNVSVVLAGGYILFWLAFSVPTNALSRLTNKIDISYGMYLYAFPIQNSLIYGLNVRDPVVLTVLSIPIAAALGYLSWIVVERPALSVAKRFDAARRVPLKTA